MEHLDLLHTVTGTLDSLSVRYFVTGSVASMAFGEYRLTNDVDIVVDLKLAQVDELCRHFQQPHYYVSSEAAREAVLHQGMFNIIHSDTALKADLIVSKSGPFDRGCFERARRFDTGSGHSPMLSSPEDVIIHKMLFHQQGGSDKHLRDIAGILKLMGPELDGRHIKRWAIEFDLLDIWQTIQDRVAHSDDPT